MIRNVTSSITILTAILFAVNIIGCSLSDDKKPEKFYDCFASVAEYINSQGDFINSPLSPGVINIDVVLKSSGKKLHIVDIRSSESFASGHLPNAVNVEKGEILNYFENIIDTGSFDTIALISSDGQDAFFVVPLLRTLGYDNVYAIRYGMGWHEQFTDYVWGRFISSDYQHLLETSPPPSKSRYPYPEIISQTDNVYQILRELTQMLLSNSQYRISASEVFDNPDDYYIICYWNEDNYNVGHIPGAFQYTPGESLRLDDGLTTLPPDRKIVVYCNTGNLSAAVASWLKLLGYDAYSIEYGTNSFMYDMQVKDIKSGFYDRSKVLDIPLDKIGKEADMKDTAPVLLEVESTGGC